VDGRNLVSQPLERRNVQGPGPLAEPVARAPVPCQCEWLRHFFKNPPAEDFPEKKDIEQETSVDKAEGIDYEQTFKEAEETELPEIKIEEHSKDWEPELYDRVQKRIEYDSAGRRITPETEEELNQKLNISKTQSFLNKVGNVFQSNTIEKEVEQLQKKK
jgi:hypothetical protein